jgi:uncharacterized membrane protein
MQFGQSIKKFLSITGIFQKVSLHEIKSHFDHNVIIYTFNQFFLFRYCFVFVQNKFTNDKTRHVA